MSIKNGSIPKKNFLLFENQHQKLVDALQPTAKKLVFVYFFKKLHNEESNLGPIQKNLNFLVLFD